MATVIRLKRQGKRNNPSFRLVVIDSRKPRDGRAIEYLGHFNPSEKPAKFEFNKYRYEHWVSVGAKPSEAVEKLIKGDYQFVPYEPHKKKEEPTPAPVTEENEEVKEAEVTEENSETEDAPVADTETNSEQVGDGEAEVQSEESTEE